MAASDPLCTAIPSPDSSCCSKFLRASRLRRPKPRPHKGAQKDSTAHAKAAETAPLSGPEAELGRVQLGIIRHLLAQDASPTAITVGAGASRLCLLDQYARDSEAVTLTTWPALLQSGSRSRSSCRGPAKLETTAANHRALARNRRGLVSCQYRAMGSVLAWRSSFCWERRSSPPSARRSDAHSNSCR